MHRMSLHDDFFKRHCNETHTRGTWKRKGSIVSISCYCGHYAIKINIDTPEAYRLFEVEAETQIDGEEVE